jgi:hypothetical protein
MIRLVTMIIGARDGIDLILIVQDSKKSCWWGWNITSHSSYPKSRAQVGLTFTSSLLHHLLLLPHPLIHVLRGVLR